MRLATQERHLPGRDLAERLALAAECGFAGVEFGGHGLRERLPEIQRALAHSPVRASTVCGIPEWDFLVPDCDERVRRIGLVKEALSMAADLGAVGLIGIPIRRPVRFPDLSPLYTSDEIERALTARCLEEIAAHAEKVGVLYLLEPLNRYEAFLLRTLNDAVTLAQQVNSPAIKIMADFFHMNIEEADIPASLRAAGPYLAHVHLADSNRRFPGAGHTDFRAGFRALREIGYQGYLALECSEPAPTRAALQQTVRYLQACLAEA